ncbi:MAG: c-type cytochrome [Halofilum sp. (in: g-proteobacteria)]|nr:c-type cytochrome [Halofilum sp. (in: g-proteobacteria)]
MFAWADTKRGLAALLALALVPAAAAQARDYGLGRTPSEAEIARWDIDIRPDGKGLPKGSGTAKEGEAVYIEKCASCHGDFAEGAGRYPALIGGEGSLDTNEPVKTIGSYWPFASTVWDYVHRAMPFGNAQSLTDDETYALTAYLLYANQLIEYDHTLNQDNLADVTMPNEDGFHRKERPEFPDEQACMADCKESVEIVGRATNIGVTPDEESGGGPGDQAAASGSGEGDQGTKLAGDPQAGKKVYQQCSACHTIEDGGAHRMGPNLHGVMGREAGGVPGFNGYSPAMKESEVVWRAETLKKYLANPREFMPGTRMPFAGIDDEKALQDLIAYLEQAS